MYINLFPGVEIHEGFSLWVILFSIFLFKPIQGILIPGACFPGLETGTLTPTADYSFAFTRVLSLSLAPQCLDQEIAFLRRNAAFRDHAQDGYALLLRIRLWLLGRRLSLGCTFGCFLLYRYISGLRGGRRCWRHWRTGRRGYRWYRGDRWHRDAQVTDGSLNGLQGSRYTLGSGTARLLFDALQAVGV